MLPVVDYGGIAIVISKISALSGVKEEDGKFSFEVYLTGLIQPISVVFLSKKEAEDNRDELIAIVARYYFMRDLGKDFDDDEIDDIINDDEDDLEIDDGGEERH